MVAVRSRSQLVLGVAALVATGTIATLVGPAGVRGGPAPVTCDKGELCLYEHDDYKGALITIRKGGKVSNKPSTQLPLQVSSVKNRRDRISILYEMTDGEGYRICLEAGERLPSLSPLGLNDDVGSAELARRAEECARNQNRACNRRELCLYQHDFYTGRILEITKVGEVSFAPFRYMNNEASSVKNRRGMRSYLYDAGPNGIGEIRCLDADVKVESLSALGFNDVVSAVRLSRSDNPCEN